MYKLSKEKLVLIVILLLAVVLRLYGLDWDQGQHLHPDERFLTMVINNTEFPNSLVEYFVVGKSSLNPNNVGYGFFVYGTVPLFITKLVATISNMHNYGDITLVGRLLSALFDVGTVYLVYVIARFIVSSSGSRINRRLPLVATFFYAISVLPIQLSHFLAVDTFLTF
ncbi:MAG: hypothetical protein Q8Q65_02655, partial [bacterium]|nr:hypothetical protein [bacterium]